MVIAVRFCPKCGGLMMPERSGSRNVLRCTKCGHVAEIAGESGYRIGGPTTSVARIYTTSLVSEAKTRARSKEEIEQEKEEYYKELFLELLREEEYGEEEG